ncbi:hypothetical protein TcBrA4_0001870 [Trypanosoma cruzi]|nr:hypothetical protein TcBrA4_0001870 [Trypanosoma cruzi]
MSRGLPRRGQPCSVAFHHSFCLCFFDNPLWLYLPVNALLFFVTVGKNLTTITRYRHFSVFQRWGAHLVAVLGLWLHVGTPLRCVAASTTETKTTSPPESFPRHARCGEVRRSACRLSEKTARPFRCGHSVDITRGGDVHKNPGTEEDGYINIWRLNIAGLSSVKKIAFAARWEQHPPDIVLLQEINNRSDVATTCSGHNDYLQVRTGRGGGVAVLVRHCLPCERLSLPGTDLLETIAVRAFPPGCRSICVANLYNPPTATVQESAFINIVCRLCPKRLLRVT